MKFYLDTEFAESPGTIHLISIGIVCETGSTFYAESTSFETEKCNDWVKANVLPKLHYRNNENIPFYHEQQMGFTKFGQFPVKAFETTAYGSNNFIRKHLSAWIEKCFPVSDVRVNQTVDTKDYLPEFWGYYCDYDWVVFCWLFGWICQKDFRCTVWI